MVPNSAGTTVSFDNDAGETTASGDPPPRRGPMIVLTFRSSADNAPEPPPRPRKRHGEQRPPRAWLRRYARHRPCDRPSRPRPHPRARDPPQRAHP